MCYGSDVRKCMWWKQPPVFPLYFSFLYFGIDVKMSERVRERVREGGERAIFVIGHASGKLVLFSSSIFPSFSSSFFGTTLTFILNNSCGKTGNGDVDWESHSLCVCRVWSIACASSITPQMPTLPLFPLSLSLFFPSLWTACPEGVCHRPCLMLFLYHMHTWWNKKQGKSMKKMLRKGEEKWK